MGIPFELITLLGSTVISGVLKIFAAKSKAKNDKELAMVAMMGKQGQLYKEAREFDNKGFRFTRRIIAILCTISIVVLPIVLGALIPAMPIWFGYTEIDPGFWPFTSDVNVVEWVKMDGIVITPFHTHIFSSIIGMYFGGSLTGDRR